ALGRRFVVMQWPNTTTDTALVVSLKNPLAISGAIERTRMFKKSVTDGFEVFHSDTLPVGVAIGEGNLIVSSSDARLRSILDQAISGDSNPKVAALIRQAPPGTTSFSTTDAGVMLESYLSMAQGFVPAQTANWHRFMADVLPSLGRLTTYVTSDAEGLSMHSQSNLGTLGTVVTIGIAVSSSLAGEIDPSMAGSGIARRAEFAWRLGEIAAAVRDSGAQSLEELPDTLDESVIGTRLPNGDFVVDGYRVTLFADAQSKRFAVVAWPDESARGDVYACFEDCAPMVNEILTHSAGMDRVSLRDVYFDGTYGAQLMTGWKHIAVTDVPMLAESDAAIELTGEDWNTYQLLVAAANGTLDLEPAEIIGHLRSDNPTIVGRAAKTVAELKLKSAIPTLGDVAPNPDVTTRRQIALTLLELDDRSTLDVSRQMLRDTDPTVRALAAANAGKHADKESVDSLLDVIVRPDPKDGDRDRVQAFLSLADIGETRCLDTACASPTAGPKQGQALAYLMQKLTPQLDRRDEAKLLMKTLAHEASIVRRYAIQRLGELRDPNSATALEGRLGTESAELRPLIEVSLTAIRGTKSPTTERVASLSERIQAWYDGLGKGSRNALVGSVAAFALVMAGAILWVFLRRRRNATDWAAMAAPSDEYAADHEAVHEDEPFLYGEAEHDEFEEAGTRWGEDPDHSAFEDYEFEERHEGHPLDR
ncbi:MAG: HEAT repeat domain-containing protein, partial [Planctomycetes bacterium]|nr:HEAT repeat domain-containing protein [Planctomycetota bacterium]